MRNRHRSVARKHSRAASHLREMVLALVVQETRRKKNARALVTHSELSLKNKDGWAMVVYACLILALRRQEASLVYRVP